MSGLTTVVHATAPSSTKANTLDTHLVMLPNSIGGVISSGNAMKIKPLNPNEKLYVLVTLPYRNSEQLQNFLAELQNPKSPYYHKYLTQQEFINEYSPSITTYNLLVNYFESYGLQVSTYNDRVSISLYGSVAQYESLFHTSLFDLKSGTSQFYAPVSSLYLPSYLVTNVINVVGLSDQYRAHFDLNIKPDFTGSGSSQILYGSDLQVPYQLNLLYQKGYPTNLTVATILWGGVDSNGNQVGAFVPSDISSYFSQTLPSNEPQPTIIGYPIQGAAAPGPSAANDSTQANYESTLDLEMVGSMAPGATVVEVYGPGSTNGGSESELDAAFADILSPPSGAPSALNNVVAISNSWGGGDTNDSTWNSYEQEAAARGITVLASSGDDGNTGNATPSFPATVGFNTYGSLAVGGTQAILTGTASQNGTGTTGFQNQSVWYNTPQSGDGSQGGVSSVFAEPSWQISSSQANSVITAQGSGRGTPDIAAVGANMYIWITTSGTAGWQELWGTSVASPLAAGEIAVMDHYKGSNYGFIDPLVYQLGQAEVNGSYASAKPFYFVSNGSNGMFSAQNGYSLAVGWGSINAYNFVLASGGTAATTYTVTFTESGLASGTSWSVTLNGTTSSSSTSTISFSEPDGSYSYSIGSVSGYTASPSSGTITVNGANVNQAITFTKSTTTSTSAIYSQVNATSANIQTYTLPEAEEFTVGTSGSVSVNYVVLYLSGSGSVEFSIGTGLWGSNILANTTVSVTSSKLWYNVSFNAVTMKGGTDYYLNVYQASGNVQWGYTSSSSTSVSKNAVTDYWYSGSTLTSDSSYPDIYTVGYYSSSSTTPAKYTVTFTESGLASGTSWSATLNGATSSSSTSTISFSEPDGSYSYSIGSVSGYTASPSSGTITVNGANVNQAITFSEVKYTVTFTESGLASGTSWSATLNGATSSSSTSTISFSEPDGSYSYSIGSVSGYTVSPSSGTITVNGANVNQAITFTQSTTSSSTSAIYSQVNATSANIQTYILPEAEEFTVGTSGSVSVNYVVLYLSGSGSVEFSIGTGLWGSNILANTTVSVTSSQSWYNVSFNAVTMNGGTDYYLNVYQASGNVQWGYTSSSSTSVSNNAVADYWYSGSTLTSDSAYPDIYTIGYSSNNIAVSHSVSVGPVFSVYSFEKFDTYYHTMINLSSILAFAEELRI